MLTIDYLKNEAQTIPPELKHITEYCLAQLIIIKTLGAEFWRRELASDGNSSSQFFKSRYEVRMLHAADLLWSLRNFNGFESMLKKNGDHAFESTYFELIAAEMIASCSDELTFVVPCGKKGEDFDLRAKSFLHIENACIEVQSRRKPFLNSTSLRNYLSEIRKQLPKNKGGVIFCKIELQRQILTQEQITDIVSNWIRNSTTRVQFVVLCWDPYENDSLAIGVAYYVIGKNGATKHAIGNAIKNNSEIRFLKDIGYKRILNEEISQLLFQKIGNTQISIELGCWTLEDTNWWSFYPQLIKIS